MNNKRKFLLLLLLLFVGVGVWYFYPKKIDNKSKVFTEQGKTEILAGDIILSVFDQSAEDGDTIQLFFKGKMIADSLEILNAPVDFNLGRLSPGEYWIGVKAINEGSTSPASAYIRLNRSGATTSDTLPDKVSFSMDAWVDSAASWKLIVK